jgi:hypothetical protein
MSANIDIDIDVDVDIWTLEMSLMWRFGAFAVGAVAEHPVIVVFAREPYPG